MAIPALVDHPLTTEHGEVRVYFDVFSERNLPTWWSVGLLVLTAVTHAVAGALGLLAVRLRGATRWCMVAGLAFLLGSAMGMELVQGLLVAEGESGPLYVLVLHAEELGENIGVLLMLAAAVRSLEITRDADRLSVRYGPSEQGGRARRLEGVVGVEMAARGAGELDRQS